MPSDTLEPRGIPTTTTTPSLLRLTPEKQLGFIMPEGVGVPTSTNGRTTTTRDNTHWESSLFSSSLSDLFSRKLMLPRSDKLAANREEEEPFESLEEMEAHTIGNLLPDEDDFFAEVTGKPRGDELVDDCDLFNSVGGMELEGDNKRGSPVEVSSRIIFVRNIDSVIDDYELKLLFEQYGDVRALHTSGKNHGFILVSYYDLRAASNAVRALHGRLLRGRKLDVRYQEDNASEGALLVNNLDASISNEELHRIISSYGEIREVRRTMHEIFIEFYDVRAAENALRGLNGCEIAGRQVNLTPQFSGLLASPSVSSFVERRQTLDVPIGLPPSTRVVSSASGIQSLPNLHPRSFPDNFASGSPYKSSEMIRGSPLTNLGLWSSNNTQQHNPWTNSPSRGNSIPFSRASPLMVNMTSSPPVHHHHIGSAPVLNSPFWDRRQQIYAAESPEPSGFRLGSPMEIGSHKVPVRSSPRHMPHLFPGRSQMLDGSFGSPNERYRNLSHRRSDSTSSNAEKKLYELDVDRILRGEDNRTTLMIKNIPNKYTSKMLIAAIDEYCKGTYDFLYLPIDFKNKCNVGYAFINLTEPENIVPFYKAFNGKKWEKFNSEKVASLAYGRIQGKSALIAHFQNSSLMNEDKRCRPILFHTAGPNAGDQEPFPMGSNVRSRPGKHRTSSMESYSNISSSYENRDEDLI